MPDLRDFPLYFITCVIIFWIPMAVIVPREWGGLSRAQRTAFWIVCLVMSVLTFGMEFVYLKADIWSFAEDSKLIGINILGVPIEEFVFWFGASPFLLGVYWMIQRRGRNRATLAKNRGSLRTRRRGRPRSRGRG